MVLFQLAVSMQKNENQSFLSPFTKVNSKWIEDIHIIPGILQLLEEKLGKNLEYTGTGEKFLNRTMACALRSRMDKWDLVRFQSFCKAKDTVKKTNDNQQIGKRSLQLPYLIGD